MGKQQHFSPSLMFKFLVLCSFLSALIFDLSLLSSCDREFIYFFHTKILLPALQDVNMVSALGFRLESWQGSSQLLANS